MGRNSKAEQGSGQQNERAGFMLRDIREALLRYTRTVGQNSSRCLVLKNFRVAGNEQVKQKTGSRTSSYRWTFTPQKDSRRAHPFLVIIVFF